MYTTIPSHIQLYVYKTSRKKSYFNVNTCRKQASKLFTLHQNVQLYITNITISLTINISFSESISR